jgi:peptidyl-prolyl cis-trans isomerase C
MATAPATSPAAVAAAPIAVATAPAATPAPAAPVTAVSPASAPATVPAVMPATIPATSPATEPAASASQPATEPAGPPVRDANGNLVDPGKVVITVGGEKITAADFDGLISDLPANQQAMVRRDGRRELADIIVRTKLLAQEAKARNLDLNPRVRRVLESVRDQILERAIISEVTEKVDDATIREFFERYKADLERVEVRHVLVRMKGSRVALRPGEQDLSDDQAKAKAQDIYKRLKAGADFAKVAREESDDTGSGRNGGDLGSMSRGRLVQPFAQAAFALKQGEISQPVRTEFGWHVIQVVQRFDTPEKLAEQIRGVLGPQKADDLVNELRKSHKTIVDDSFFGPPPPPEPVLPLPAGAAPVAPK